MLAANHYQTPAAATPRSILGSNLALWTRSNRFDVATGVSRVYDLAKGSAQDAVQATAADQPTTYGVSSVTGFRRISGDGTSDNLIATLSSALAASSRPYVWLVYRSLGGSTSVVLALNNTAGDRFNAAYFVDDIAGPRVGMVNTEGSAGDGINGPGWSSAMRLWEIGFLTTSTGRLVVNGVSYNGTQSGGAFRSTERVIYNAFTTGTATLNNFNTAEIYEVVVADAIPSATQLQMMRDYFVRTYALPMYWEPSYFLNGNLVSWWRADSALTSGSAITSVTSWTGASIAQGTGSKQPTLVSGAMRFDGTDDTLTGTVTSPTSRHMIWAVARLTSVRGSFDYGLMTWNNATGNGQLAPIRTNPSTSKFTAVIGSTDGVDIPVGPALDTNTHLFELAVETTSTGRYVVDGVAYNGAFTGALAFTTDRITVGAYMSPESSWGPIDYYEVGLTSTIPTTAQRQQLREYVRRRYGISVA